MGRQIDEAVIHDRLFECWRAAREPVECPLPAIADFFHAVEAYDPDLALRTPDSPFEAASA